MAASKPSELVPKRRFVVPEFLWPEILRGNTDDRRTMVMVWSMFILPLRAVAPTACIYWTWRIFRVITGRSRRPPWPRGFAAQFKYLAAYGAKKLLSFWLGIEVIFLVFFLHKRRSLEQQTAKPPQIPSGCVVPMLRRMFQATEDIQAAGKIPELGSRTSAARTPMTPRTRNNSIADLQSSPLVQRESNVEELLREWDATQRDLLPAVPGLPSAMSLQDCVSLEYTEAMIDDAEMFALKQAEVSGWFVQRCTGSSERWPAARIGEIRRGNMEEFLAFVFFHCNPHEVPAARRGEFEQLLEEGSRWVGIKFTPGYNDDVQPMRVTMDRIVAEHRPFSFYALTALVLPFVTDRMIGHLGFTRYSSGTLTYWHHLPGWSENHDPTAPRGQPIVFIHGLGINILPYYSLVAELLKMAGDRPVFLVSLPHISMRLQSNVPSCTEMVACLSDMLAGWGHSSAHFVGHSFGTLPLAWMVRLAPSRVSMVTFIDPVCFLIIKPDVCYNFIYRRPTTPAQLISSFFVGRELFIANSLSRNFFWFNNLLWPEDLSMPAIVALSGKDAIVPAHSVRRYLSVYKQRHGLASLKVRWFPDLAHGEACLPGSLDAGRSIIQDMLLMDSLYSSEGLQKTPVAVGD